MSAARITSDEMMESLTGFDEIAIEKAFGSIWEDLAQSRPSTFSRALVFIDYTRQGQNAGDAKNAALALPLKDVQAYFADEEEDHDDEVGKDATPPASEPTSSPVSASPQESAPASTAT